jgi:hypothetical protein
MDAQVALAAFWVAFAGQVFCALAGLAMLLYRSKKGSR